MDDAVASVGEKPGAALAAAPTPARPLARPADKPPGGEPDPRDWTYWRGPRFDGISPETGLIDDWNPDGGAGSHLAWKRQDLGGRSTPIVMQGRLYTIVRADPGTPVEGEKVVCVDAATGETIWENRFNVYLSDVPDTRVGWSSCVGDPTTGRVYALGVCGLFLCIDAETGQTVWQLPLHEQFGLLSTFGGRTNFPIVCDDLVIISGVVIGWGEMAKPAHRFLAMDKATGEVVWFTGTRLLPEDTTYSAPSLAVLDNRLALVVGSGDGALWAFQPRTGRPLWHFQLSRRGLDLPPLVAGQRIYMGHSEENLVGTSMGAVVAIDGRGRDDITQSGELWRVDQLAAARSAPLLIDGRLWVFDDRAKLHILDAETGAPVANRIALGTMMRASPLYADAKVYAVTTQGRWYILQPDPERGAVILSKGRLGADEEVNASPICAHGRIYLQSSGALYCLMDEGKQHGADPLPTAAAEPPVKDDPAPAHAQLVPAELLMRPGEKQTFEVRLFNSRGQFLRASQATFEVDGPGSVSPAGVYAPPADARHVAAIVTARVGPLSAVARVRVVPDLPWTFDFEDVPLDANTRQGEPPVSWVGARYRHVIRDLDGNKVMVKVTTIPKGTRSRCWFGHPELHDYTIQADLQGGTRGEKMPDIGLIAQGYTLDLQGAHQKLQLRTWDAQLRVVADADFPWQPDRWYTMKLRVANESGKAVARGKVWPRDESEPEAWTVELIDDSPNTAGSPGLFGNATDAEILLDNIRVTPD